METNQVESTQLKRLGQWLVSRDTGVSSRTMAAIALGSGPDEDADYDAPYDPADFGRCRRLVAACPFIREHFDSIGTLVPAFAPILAEWDELCRLYDRDLPTGRSDVLYNRLRVLRGRSPLSARTHPTQSS